MAGLLNPRMYRPNHILCLGLMPYFCNEKTLSNHIVLMPFLEVSSGWWGGSTPCGSHAEGGHGEGGPGETREAGGGGGRNCGCNTN